MKKTILAVATLATVAVSTAGINGALRLYGVAGGTALPAVSPHGTR